MLLSLPTEIRAGSNEDVRLKLELGLQAEPCGNVIAR